MEDDIKTTIVLPILKMIGSLEENFGLEKGFFFMITKEDDWSYIIKLHALLEAAVSHLLTKVLGKEELSGVFATLDMSDKVAFVESLNLLDTGNRRFIRKLSKYRNKLVHDVSNVRFSITENVKSLNKDARKDFVESFVNNMIEVDKASLFLGEPKTLIIFGAIRLMLSIYEEDKKVGSLHTRGI